MSKVKHEFNIKLEYLYDYPVLITLDNNIKIMVKCCGKASNTKEEWRQIALNELSHKGINIQIK